jgi:hypothetical protein
LISNACIRLLMKNLTSDYLPLCSFVHTLVSFVLNFNFFDHDGMQNTPQRRT